MSKSAEYYRHSGVVPVPGLLITSASALLVASAIGFLYSQVLLRTEYTITAAVVIAAAFAATIGFGVATLSEMTKLRSTSVPVAIALLAGLCGLWVAWGTDIAVRGFWEGAGFTLAPSTIQAYVGELSRAGSFSLDDSGVPVTGFLCHVVWGIEALIFIGGAATVCYMIQGDAVFCERCNKWVRTEPIKEIDRDGTATLVERLGKGDLSAVYYAREANPGAKNYVLVEITRCACHTCNYITLTSVRHDDEGNEQRQRLVVNQRVTDGDALRVLDPRGMHPDDYADEETRHQRRSDSSLDACEQTRAHAPSPRVVFDESCSEERTRLAHDHRREQRRRRARREEELRAQARRDREAMRRADRRRAERRRPSDSGKQGVRFRCPHCRKKHRVPAEYAGRKGRCPSCKEAVRVPVAV